MSTAPEAPPQQNQPDLLTLLQEQEAHLASFRALVFSGQPHGDKWVVDGKEARRLLIVGAGKALLEDYLKTKAVLGVLLKEREDRLHPPAEKKTTC